MKTLYTSIVQLYEIIHVQYKISYYLHTVLKNICNQGLRTPTSHLSMVNKYGLPPSIKVSSLISYYVFHNLVSIPFLLSIIILLFSYTSIVTSDTMFLLYHLAIAVYILDSLIGFS